MQSSHVLVFLVILLVALLGLSLAAPAEEPAVSGLEQLPAMLVRSGPGQLLAGSPRQCTNNACYNLCRSLGWSNGFCLDAEWCLCYN